jgi:hypothetical protein
MALLSLKPVELKLTTAGGKDGAVKTFVWVFCRVFKVHPLGNSFHFNRICPYNSIFLANWGYHPLASCCAPADPPGIP